VKKTYMKNIRLGNYLILEPAPNGQ
jgi:hypothetical protein